MFLVEPFKKYANKLLSHLRAPKEMKSEFVHIIPAFFETILGLEKLGKKFSIVFRTFGSDIERVAEEFNLFCKGKHPMYPNVYFDGTNGSRDLTLQTSRIGNFYRNGNCFLIMGTTNQISEIDKSLTAEKIQEYYKQKWNQNVTVIEGYKKCYDHIIQLAGSGTCAIRDHYNWWYSHDELPTAGKLFLIDKKDKKYLQIFFDDNIKMSHNVNDKRGIVDIRSAEKGEALDYRKYLGEYLHHVEPLLSITDKQYFLKLILGKSLKK